MEIIQARQVPGFTSIYQHQRYAEVAKLLPKNAKFLEIGVLFGRSTWAWLDVLPDDTTYDVLDSFNVDASEIPDFVRSDRMPKFGKNLDIWSNIVNMLKNMSHKEVWNFVMEHHPKYKLLSNVTSMSTHQYIYKKYCSTYDAIYLDSEHTYEHTKKVLEYFKDTKVICGDDYKNKDWPELEIAVKEFAKNYNFKLTEYPENLFFILEKQ